TDSGQHVAHGADLSGLDVSETLRQLGLGPLLFLRSCHVGRGASEGLCVALRPYTEDTGRGQSGRMPRPSPSMNGSGSDSRRSLSDHIASLSREILSAMSRNA